MWDYTDKVMDQFHHPHNVDKGGALVPLEFIRVGHAEDGNKKVLQQHGGGPGHHHETDGSERHVRSGAALRHGASSPADVICQKPGATKRTR